MVDRHMRHNTSFVTMLGGAGATRRNYCIRYGRCGVM